MVKFSSGIGGSDIASVMGFDKYRTALQLYYEKRGEIPKFEGNDATEVGNLLEDIVARRYAAQTGQKIQRVRKTLRRKDYPYMLARIDRRIVGIQKGLEVKTALSRFFKEADWEEAPPLKYQLQCQWYMWVTSWDLWDLTALVAGPEFRTYAVERDETTIWNAREAAKEFWARVLEGRPPEPVNENDCKMRWAIDAGESVIATPESVAQIESLASIQAQIADLEEQASALKTVLKIFMGEKAYLLGPNGEKLATWKNNSEIDEERVKLEAPQEYAAAVEPRFSVSKFRKANPALAKQFVKPSETRVFRLA